jgi:hypothetical protein
MSELTIRHTLAEGTTLSGSRRGDGTAEQLKPLGWRWGRTLAAWYLPRSRDTRPNTATISATSERLRAVGHSVTTELDTTPRDPGEIAEDKRQRSLSRAWRLEARAARQARRAEELHARADQLTARFAGGQPILTGHHSEACARADLDRSNTLTRRALAEDARAQGTTRAAVAARSRAEHQDSPGVVACRLDRLAAQQRQLRARLAQRGPYLSAAPLDPGYRAQLEEQLGQVTRQLEHWQSVHAEQLRTGAAEAVGPDTVSVGDQVKISGTWRQVTRVNAKSVTVATETGSGRAPWHQVNEHRRASSGEQS